MENEEDPEDYPECAEFPCVIPGDESTTASPAGLPAPGSPKSRSFHTACAACSLQGPRESNQDRACALRLILPGEAEIAFAAVADGMGGHEGGERAARLALRGVLEEAVCQAVQDADGIQGFRPEQALCSGLLRGQRYLAHVTARCPDFEGMGATLTAAIALGRELHVASLGDTRLHLWSGGELLQLTRDDSVVQCLVDEGAISSAEAEGHPLANVVTRALCVEEDLTPCEVIRCGLLPGDVVIISSDGFWKYAADWLPEVLDELDGRDVNEDRLMQAAQALARRALEQGSDDNVSIALLRCGDSTVKPRPRRVTVETTQQEEAS